MHPCVHFRNERFWLLTNFFFKSKGNWIFIFEEVQMGQSLPSAWDTLVFPKLYGFCFLKIKLAGGRLAPESCLGFRGWGSVLLCDYKIQQFFGKFKMEFYTKSQKWIWWDSIFLFPAYLLSLTGENASAMMDLLGGPRGPLFSSQIIYGWIAIFLLHFPSSWGIMY